MSARLIAGLVIVAAVLMVSIFACARDSSAKSDWPNIYQHNVQLDDGRTITCIVFDNASYEGDMITCDWK
jgi:hypothetical protein